MSDFHTNNHADLSRTDRDQTEGDQRELSTQPVLDSPTKTAKGSALNRSALTGLKNTNSSNNLARLDAPPENIVVMAKYTAFWANKKEDDKVYSVVVELPHLESVHEAIKDVIPLLNQKLEAENSPYALVDDPTLFNLYKAKKTGHAKLDFPALDSSQILNQTGIQQISLYERDPKAVILRGSNAPIRGNPFAAAPKEQPAMVTTTMPPARNIEQPSVGTVSEVVETTCCFCIPVKKVVTRPGTNNVSADGSLHSGLLGNQL